VTMVPLAMFFVSLSKRSVFASPKAGLSAAS